MPCVLGSHDEFLLVPNLIAQYAPAPAVIAAVDWCRSELRSDDFGYLRGCEREIEVPLGAAGNLRLFHGSPRSHMEMILATTPPDDLDVMLDGRRGALLAGGHTHVQMLRQHRGQLLLNAGSVGMPFREAVGAHGATAPPRILPHAEYAIVRASVGRIAVELRRVEMDRDQLRDAVLTSGIPHRESFASQYL